MVTNLTQNKKEEENFTSCNVNTLNKIKKEFYEYIETNKKKKKRGGLLFLKEEEEEEEEELKQNKEEFLFVWFFN